MFIKNAKKKSPDGCHNINIVVVHVRVLISETIMIIHNVVAGVSLKDGTIIVYKHMINDD